MKSRFIVYIPTDTREATAVSFAKVAGVPLFLRPILALNQAGEKAFTVIAPLSHRRHLLKLWGKTVKNRDVHLNLLLTKDSHRISAEEIKELEGYCEQSTYLINANYLFPDMPKMILSHSNSKVGVNEVKMLKPATMRGAVLGFSLQSLDEAAVKAGGYPLTMQEFIDEMIAGKNLHFISEGGESIMVQRFADIKIAETILTEHIRVNTQTFVAREINKRISLPISLMLSRMRIAPNSITIINMFIGLSAGIGAAGLTYKGVLIGAILFQIASIVDGCDGEVAKLTFRTSKFGQYIDSLSDNLSLAAFLTGMMIHQYRVTGSYVSFVFGALLIVGALLIILLMIDYLKKRTDSASFVTFDKEFLQRLSPRDTPRFVLGLIKYFKIFFKKDFFSLMFLITAIFGILHWWFYCISICVWAGVFVLAYLREKHYK